MFSGDFATNVQQSIKNIIDKEGFLTYDIQSRRITTSGCSFLGNLYEVDIKGKTKCADKEANLFVKVINGGENLKCLSISNIYRIELFAYRELSEIFAVLQEAADIPAHERYKMVKSYDGGSTEAIILENIAQKGFKVPDRLQVVSLDVAEMAIKELAKLHGLSFTLQQQRPDYFNSVIKNMQYPKNFEYFHEFVVKMINLTMKYIDDDVKDRVEGAYYKLADKYPRFFNDEATRRCLCHGDYKSSNMMIKMNNGKVTDLIAVDYQFLHYGCPVLDILFFIYLNTDHQFRKAHLSHLKDLYHETLTMFLGYFNIDVDLVYSRETFERDFKEKLEYGLLVGFVVVPLILVKEDCVPDLTADVSGISLQVNDTYRDRQRGMIEEFIQWGYL